MSFPVLLQSSWEPYCGADSTSLGWILVVGLDWNEYQMIERAMQINPKRKIKGTNTS
jgi:hypothetical protein